MIVFVVNCTNQNQILNYRLPEFKSVLNLPIAAGDQQRIGIDMNVPQLESFIGQMRKYGLFTVEEVMASKPDRPIVWIVNTERAVPQNVLNRVTQYNMGVIIRDGQMARRKAALMTSAQMRDQAHTPGAAQNLEVSLEQVTGDEAGKYGEGIAVSADPAKVGNDRRSSGRGGARPAKA